jgi:hypothetical protein
MSASAPSGLRAAAARSEDPQWKTDERRREAPRRWRSGLVAAAVIGAGAVVLRVLSGVGFANYDTLYALVWGQQLARGEGPQYAVPIAPTPHPLMEALGFVLSPLGPGAVSDVSVWVVYVALAACGYLVYRLGARWFNRPVGVIAALILLTRNPILSYGSRAYIDLPFLALMLGAMLLEARRPRAGASVLALLALAGLLRPEAWVFSGLYWLYLAADGRVVFDPRTRRLRRIGIGEAGTPASSTVRTPRELAGLALLGCSAPALWLLSDALVTGNPLWSLTHTKQTASTLDRVTGIANVPQYIPRRIGEIMRPVELVAAALGGVLALAWLLPRARMAAIVGVVAVLVFAVLAGLGLPIDTRYAFLASAILCVFCGVGVFGWMLLPAGDRRRRPWALAGALLLIALLASVPSEYARLHSQFRNLARQQRAQNDLVALVQSGELAKRCGPIGVPNHAPIPLLALWLHAPPGRITSEQVRPVSRGTYVEAASKQVSRDYILDPHEPHPLTPSVPGGFVPAGGNRSWVLYERCV